jgi:ribosomal 50S subunit-associated protein YjgA (DUF615 family)
MGKIRYQIRKLKDEQKTNKKPSKTRELQDSVRKEEA